jgi:hypothetical protein
MIDFHQPRCEAAHIGWVAGFITEDPDVFYSEDRTPPPRDWNAGISDRNKSLNTGGGSRLMKEGERIERYRRQRADAVDAERRAEDPEGREDSEGRKIDPTSWERMTTQDQVSNARKMRHAQGGKVGGEDKADAPEEQAKPASNAPEEQAKPASNAPEEQAKPASKFAHIDTSDKLATFLLKFLELPQIKGLPDNQSKFNVLQKVLKSPLLGHLDKETKLKGLKQMAAVADRQSGGGGG